MELVRLIKFMEALASTGMNRENLVARGFDFAFTGYLANAEQQTRKSEAIPNGLRLELMEQAADLLQQAVRTMEEV